MTEGDGVVEGEEDTHTHTLFAIQMYSAKYIFLSFFVVKIHQRLFEEHLAVAVEDPGNLFLLLSSASSPLSDFMHIKAPPLLPLPPGLMEKLSLRIFPGLVLRWDQEKNPS